MECDENDNPRFAYMSEDETDQNEINLFENYEHKEMRIKEAVTGAMGKEWTDKATPYVESLAEEDICVKYRNEHKISLDETHAISYYTLEFGKDSLYSILNTALSQRKVDAKWLPYLWILLGGLDKLPNKEVEVYRAVKVKLGNNVLYSHGNVIVYITFTSTSKKIDQLPHFSNKINECGCTWFKIHAKEGKDISPFSKYKKEEEIILKPNTYLKVRQLPKDFKQMMSLSTPNFDYFVMKELPSKIKIFDACFNGDLDKLKNLLRKLNLPLNIENINRKDHPSLLYTAVAQGHTEIVKYLLQNGANVNRGQGEFPKSTPLHGAVWNKREEICHELIKYGADLKMVNDHMKTPLNEREIDKKLKEKLDQWSKEAERANQRCFSSRLLLTNEERVITIDPYSALILLNIEQQWLDSSTVAATSRYEKLKRKGDKKFSECKFTEYEFIALYTFLIPRQDQSLMALFEKREESHKWRYFMEYVIRALQKITSSKQTGYISISSLKSAKVVLDCFHTIKESPDKEHLIKCECHSGRRLHFVNPSFPASHILCPPEAEFQYCETKKALIQVKSKDSLKLELFWDSK